MGIHGCNELCEIGDAMHYAQRRLLPMEGHEKNRKKLLIKALKEEIESDKELLDMLE